MKIRWFFLAAVMAVGVAVTPAGAQQKPLSAPERDKVKAEVTAFLKSYVDAFSAGDVKTIAGKVYANPSFSLGPKGMTMLTSEQLAANFAGSFKELEKEQYDHSEFSTPWVCVLNARSAIAGGTFKRIRKDGSVLLDASASYLFINTPDGWRIAGPIGLERDKTMTCD